MGTFYAQYASPAQVSIGAQGTNGATAPTVSLEVAGINPSGNLTPLAMDASGNLLVSVQANPIQDVNLTQIGGAAVTEGQKTMANSLPVAIASDQSTLPISAASLPLPAGAATAANQATEISSLSTIATNTGTTATNTGSTATSVTSIDTKTPTVGQKAMAASSPVVIASDQSTIPVSVASVPLPTGASTAALQSNVQSAPGTPQTVAITVQGNASGVAVPVSAASLPLPSGAATAANQTNASQKTQIVDGSGNVIGSTTNALDVNVKSATTLATTTNLTQVGGSSITLAQKTSANSLPVVLASDQSAVTVAQSTAANLKASVNLNDGSGSAVNKGQTTMSGSLPVTIASDQSALNTTSAGFSAVNKATNNYGSVNVTTSAYTQILASTSAAVKEVEIFDSSGQALVLATGAAASEVDQVYIFPGGNGRIRLAIAASTRVSIKAVSANATSGNIYVNFYG